MGLCRVLLHFFRIILCGINKVQVSVSVVIPVYNSYDSLAKSLDSIVAQSVSVEEVIVVDDGSFRKEGAYDLIERYKKFLNLHFFELGSNFGAAYARNFGVLKANAKYLAFLDSDDVWSPQKIETQFYFMEKGGYHLTGHGYIFDLSSVDFPDFLALKFKYRVVPLHRFVWGNPIFTPTVMVRREGFVLFDDDFRRMEDYKCWFENFRKGGVATIDAYLAGGFKQPIGSSGLSGSVELMHKDYLSVLQRLYKNGAMSFAYYFSSRLVEFLKYPVRLLKVSIREFIYVRKNS